MAGAPSGDAEQAGDARRRRHDLVGDDAQVRLQPVRLHAGAVARQRCDRLGDLLRADEAAAAVVLVDQPGFGDFRQRQPHDVAADAELAHERFFRGELVAGPELARLDLALQPHGELAVEGRVAVAVEAGHAITIAGAAGAEDARRCRGAGAGAAYEGGASRFRRNLAVARHDAPAHHRRLDASAHRQPLIGRPSRFADEALGRDRPFRFRIDDGEVGVAALRDDALSGIEAVEARRRLGGERREPLEREDALGREVEEQRHHRFVAGESRLAVEHIVGAAPLQRGVDRAVIRARRSAPHRPRRAHASLRAHRGRGPAVSM